MSRLVAKLSSWLPPALWAAVLFALSSIPGSRVPTFPLSFADKIEHGLVYCVLGALCFRALARTARLSVGAMVAVGTAIALAYGISDEIHQIFVPGRTADPRDVAADAIGGLLGCLTALTARWFRARRTSR